MVNLSEEVKGFFFSLRFLSFLNFFFGACRPSSSGWTNIDVSHGDDDAHRTALNPEVMYKSLLGPRHAPEDRLSSSILHFPIEIDIFALFSALRFSLVNVVGTSPTIFPLGERPRRRRRRRRSRTYFQSLSVANRCGWIHFNLFQDDPFSLPFV